MINLQTDIEAISLILSKSPLIITKEEFKNTTQLILMHQLHLYVIPLLRMQEYYLYFDLPLIIKLNIDLLSFFEEERINFFQIIGYVTFNIGDWITFYQNLVLFKYRQFQRLKGKNYFMLHKVIGDIIAPLWWHYELFKQNVSFQNPAEYHQLAYILMKHQENNDQDYNINFLQKISKQYKLIISNSIQSYETQEDLSQKTKIFIQNLMKNQKLQHQDLVNYINTSSYFSLKKRLIYYKLLFYYWHSCKYQLLKEQAQSTQSEQFNREAKPFSSSRIQSTLQVSAKYSQIISHKKTLSGILTVKSTTQLLLFLEENIRSFQEQLVDETLEAQFHKIIEEQNDLFLQIENISLQSWSDFLSVLPEKEKVLKVLNKINIEVIIRELQSRKISLFYYGLFIEPNDNLIKNLNLIDMIIEKTKLLEYKTLTDEFYKFYGILIGKSQFEQRQIISIISSKLQLTKSQQNIMFRCLQVKIQDHYITIETALRLKNITSVYDCLFHQQWLSELTPNDWQFLKSIVHQQSLVDIFYLILQCCFDKELFMEQLQNILKNLLQIIDLEDSSDVVLYLFKFALFEINLSAFLEMIFINQCPDIGLQLQESIIQFLQKVLEIHSIKKKKLILQGVQMAFPFSKIYHIDFVIEQMDQASESLMLYIRMQNIRENSQIANLALLASKLHLQDPEFYKKFIKAEHTPGIDLELIKEIEISQIQAKEMNKLLFLELSIPTKEDYMTDINKYIKSQEISSRRLMKELDQLLLLGQSIEYSENDIFEYNTNQLKFIQTIAERKINQIQLRIKQKLGAIEKLAQKCYSQKLIISNMNKRLIETKRSIHYFSESASNTSSPNIMYQIIFEILQGKSNAGKLLIKKEYQDIFSSLPKQSSGIIFSTSITQQIPIQEIIAQYQSKIKQDQQIPVLKTFLQELEREINTSFVQLSDFVKELLEIRFEQELKDLQLNMVGCLEICPICRRKCDQNVAKKHKHKCQLGHQLRSFGGVVVNGRCSLVSCEEIKDNYLVYDIKSSELKKWDKLKLTYKNWNFNCFNEEELADHQKQQMMIWNDKIGLQICSKLNVRFTPKFEECCQMLIHYIIVIDESASMAGEKWKNIITATKRCLIQLSENENVRITIILFSDDARLAVGQQQPEQVNVEEQIQQVTMNSGGTEFEPVFSLILYSINRFINSFDQQTILFFTDGDSEFPNYSMEQFMTLQDFYKKRIEILLCSESPSSAALQQICKWLSSQLFQCQLLQSISTIQLSEIWTEAVTMKY